ncbi:hypothetical protein MRX96_027088 [Rhipicephalus microplus]
MVTVNKAKDIAPNKRARFVYEQRLKGASPSPPSTFFQRALYPTASSAAAADAMATVPRCGGGAAVALPCCHRGLVGSESARRRWAHVRLCDWLSAFALLRLAPQAHRRGKLLGVQQRGRKLYGGKPFPPPLLFFYSEPGRGLKQQPVWTTTRAATSSSSDCRLGIRVLCCAFATPSERVLGLGLRPLSHRPLPGIWCVSSRGELLRRAAASGPLRLWVSG